MESTGFVHEPKPYRVLLYYKYVEVNKHEKYAEHHLQFCKALGVLGRIRIAHEGINGTLCGSIAQTEAYMSAMHMDERFGDMVFKIDEADEQAFTRLSVKPVSDLVNFGEEGASIDPNETTGEYLAPVDFMQALKRDDVIVLDARNDYEYDYGHFDGAIRPDVRTFREMPRWIRKNFLQYKDRKVLTYCTGGIRCEKLTGFLIKEGFSNVSQLRGGIISYLQDEDTKGRLYEGDMFVFDERIATGNPQHDTSGSRQQPPTPDQS